MFFLFWTLFIMMFLLTVFVIIAVLQKKYHGWKSFFIILLIVNLLIVCLLFAYVFYIIWDSTSLHQGEIGSGTAGGVILILPFPFLTLLIIDFIVVFPYYFIRHWHDKSKIIIYAALIPAISTVLILAAILARLLF